MIKNIISGREEDASIFLHCICGKEIIQLYYYKEDSILNEIIGLQFYGQIEDPKDLIFNNFQFTKNSFIEFIMKLEEYINTNYDKDQVLHMSHYGEDILSLSKDTDGFFVIGRSKNVESAQLGLYIWDIAFRLPEAQEFLNSLKEIKNIINENDKNKKEQKKRNKLNKFTN